MERETRSPAAAKLRSVLLGAVAVPLLAAAALLSLPALADQDVLQGNPLTATGPSRVVHTLGARANDVLGLQVSWTGGSAVTLEATIDGTNWNTIYPQTGSIVSGKIFTVPILGGTAYRIRVGTCTGCAVGWYVTASGQTQVSFQ